MARCRPSGIVHVGHKSFDSRTILIGAFLLGVAIRAFALDYTTPDWGPFLQPWYEHMRDRGFAGLADAFTNYAPFYTYLVGIAALFDGIASPVTLIKWLTFPFELANALVAMRIVRVFNPRPERAAVAFAALWLSPPVLHNGAFWAQCDSIWTFFLLLAVWAAVLDRVGWTVLAFAAAVSVKLQGIFLAPFLLGLVLRRSRSVAWFALVPVVYALFAVPTLIAGRSLLDVAAVYLGQADYYGGIWRGAANLYVLLPSGHDREFTAAGLALAALGGAVLAMAIARAAVLSRESILVAAALSLALMPFLLPKMHDRFFYAFDATIVILACLRPVFVPVAAAALLNSVNCYLPFDGRGDFGQAVAGLQSLIIIGFLAFKLRRSLQGRPIASADPERDRLAFVRPTAALWFAYLAYRAAANVLPGLEASTQWPKQPAEPLGMAFFAGVLAVSILLFRRLMPSPAPVSTAV